MPLNPAVHCLEPPLPIPTVTGECTVVTLTSDYDALVTLTGDDVSVTLTGDRDVFVTLTGD